MCCAATARSADPDPWFGHDKVLHFGASATIAAGGYTVGVLAFDSRSTSILLGSGLALGAGAAKELYDLTGRGDPSWRDLAWDMIGTAAGIGAAWGVDLALRGTGSQHAVLVARPNPPGVTATIVF